MFHPTSHCDPRWSYRAAAAALILSLTACGGGGGDPSANASITSATATPAATTATAATPQATSAPATAEATTSNATQTAQSIRQATPPSGATTYYVDSANGNDTNDGKSATAASGHGPWQTLARLAAATIAPGDTVRLTCGSVWHETLKLANSGTSTAPIYIGAYPGGCANSPTIDGSVAVPASAWTNYKGNIYKAAMTVAPLQIATTAGTFTIAHHPNRGFDSTLPASLYLHNAIDANNVLAGGHQASTYLTTGTDLKLPTGVTLTPGTGVRVRTNAWTIDESTIASVSGTRLNLTTPTSYPLLAGWGYFFVGQLWMLDSPGEWVWDDQAKVVYAWMPTSVPPQNLVSATTLATGIDLNSRQYVNVYNIAIRMVGTGISMQNSTGVSVQNSKITDTVDFGIDATSSTSALIQTNTVVRSGVEAIGGDKGTAITILNNSVTDAGVTMAGETVLSLPRKSRAAIIGGLGATISGNSVVNASYNGITLWAQSSVSNNYVSGACSVIDDCAGIYTSNSNNNSVIAGNVVQHSRGTLEGKPTNAAVTQAQGIYLDDETSGVTVKNNTVTDTDNGLQIHIANTNTILANRLYGNRKSQIWLQANNNITQPTGDVFGNVVTGNQIAPTSSSARGLYLQTQYQDTYGFAQFDKNVYLDRVFARMATEESPSSLIDYGFPAWKAATLPDGTPRNLDVHGIAASTVKYAPALVTGPSIVPNGKLAADSSGWAGWNKTAAFGILSRQACTLGYCASYVAGDSPGIVSTPNFSVQQNQWYRVSFDLQAGVDGQLINVLVRRGGGGSNGYEALSNVYFTAKASRTLTRYTYTMQALKTVNAGDPVTQDYGARMDIEKIQPGQTLAVTNVEIVPITAADSATQTALLLNTTAASMQASCPATGTAASACSLYVRLSDNAPVTWPYTVAARSGEIIYTLDPTLIDADGDGIADSQDSCPATATGVAVNAAGCAIGQ